MNKHICVNPCPSVVSTLSVSSVYSLVKKYPCPLVSIRGSKFFSVSSVVENGGLS